jgi:hypothetical protein
MSAATVSTRPGCYTLTRCRGKRKGTPGPVIKPDIAFRFSMGEADAVDNAGNVFTADLPDSARIELGRIVLRFLAAAGRYESAAKAERQLAARWPGHFGGKAAK